MAPRAQGRGSPPIEPPLVLAIDVGSSRTRAAAFDHHGRFVPGTLVRRATPLRRGADGAAELDPEALLHAVSTCLDGAVARLQDRVADTAAVAAVAATTLGGSILGLDARGRPLTPLLTYADTRAATDARALRDLADESALHDRTGARLHPGYAPAQVRWLARNRPADATRVRRWTTLGGWLGASLAGSAAVSISEAAWTGLLDRRALDWDGPLLAMLELDPAVLPRLAGRGPFGRLRPTWARRWPALARVPWLPAVVDGWAATVGLGATVTGRWALGLGTTSALRVVRTDATTLLPAGLFSYPVESGRWLLGGALTEGAGVLDWLRRIGVVEGVDDPVLRRALESTAPVDAHGLTIVPALGGERSPGWRPEARAMIAGLGTATGRGEFVRAWLEAVAARLGLVGRVLASAAGAPQVVLAGGGAPQAWFGLVADALGLPVAVVDVPEPTARGAAVLALEALGVRADAAEQPAPLSRTYEPDATRHARYLSLATRQARLQAAVDASRDGGS